MWMMVVVVGGEILWDVCPLISLCVRARARGVCSVREEKGDGVVRTRCHKNTEICLNCTSTGTERQEELHECGATDGATDGARPEFVFGSRGSSCECLSLFLVSCLSFIVCDLTRGRASRSR